MVGPTLICRVAAEESDSADDTDSSASIEGVALRNAHLKRNKTVLKEYRFLVSIAQELDGFYGFGRRDFPGIRGRLVELESILFDEPDEGSGPTGSEGSGVVILLPV